MLVNLKTKEEFHSLFKNGKFIGKGTTSTIYLKDGKVIKVYDLLKERTRILFNVFDMEKHLLELSKVNIKNRNLIIISVSIALGLGITTRPELLTVLPESLKLLFGSGISTGTIFAVMLNILLKDTE